MTASMPDPASAIILAFTYLAVKHMLGDFFLQTPYQFENKGTYGHPGGLLHAGIHASLTAPVFWILAASSGVMAIAILAGEFVTHYHIDWLKEQIVKKYAFKVGHSWFWRILGIDQLLHGLTYVAIITLLTGVAL